MELAMVDDLIVPIEDAEISAHDRCVYFGDGVYEVIRAIEGKFFALQEHFSRLESSLDKMDMLEKVDLALIRRRIDQAYAASQIRNALIYFQITRGRALRSHDYDDNTRPGFLLTVRDWQPKDHPVSTAITHPDWRWKRCDIKSLNLLANVMAKHAAVKAGAYEALLVDDQGFVTEGTSTTVMVVRDGVLLTAPLTANILPGVTREIILPWARQIGLDVREESFTVPQALTADELFVTGSGTEVMGITKLDQQNIGRAQIGPCTRKFQSLLLDAMHSGKIR